MSYRRSPLYDRNVMPIISSYVPIHSELAFTAELIESFQNVMPDYIYYNNIDVPRPEDVHQEVYDIFTSSLEQVRHLAEHDVEEVYLEYKDEGLEYVVMEIMEFFQGEDDFVVIRDLIDVLLHTLFPLTRIDPVPEMYELTLRAVVGKYLQKVARDHDQLISAPLPSLYRQSNPAFIQFFHS